LENFGVNKDKSKLNKELAIEIQEFNYQRLDQWLWTQITDLFKKFKSRVQVIHWNKVRNKLAVNQASLHNYKSWKFKVADIL